MAQFGQNVIPFYKSLLGKDPKEEENILIAERLFFEEKIRPLYFIERRHELDSESSIRLEQYTQLLKNSKFQKLIIEGHSSPLEPSINYPLSNYRAMAIREALVRAGIPPSKIETVGYGAEDVSKNSTTSYQNKGIIKIVW